MEIGKAILEIMEERGITPAQMCRDLNLKAGYVSMLINSKTKDIKLARAYEIAKYLGVSLEDLVDKANNYESK